MYTTEYRDENYTVCFTRTLGIGYPQTRSLSPTSPCIAYSILLYNFCTLLHDCVVGFRFTDS